MSEIDHDEFLPPVVKLSTSPYCTYISSSQYDGTHYHDSTQYGNQYNSTACTSLPLHDDSPRTCQSTVNVHNDRQVDSAHFVVSMPYDSHTSPSLVHLCNDRPTDSIHVVPYVDTLGSSQCHTRHLSTGGVPRNGHVLVLNLNPMPTYASTGSVNSNPIMVARQETPSLADSNWVHSPHLNCSNSSFSLQALTPTNPTAAYCVGNEILIPKAHFFLQNQTHKTNSHFFHFATLTMSPPELTRSPPTEATTPPAHCIKPTKHMANYVATTGDFAAPFDAVKNAVLPSNTHSIYPTKSNTLNTADTIINYSPKKSPEPAPGHFQRIPTASTPEHESAVISRYLALAHQERLQLKNKTANLASKSSNEVGSTTMGRSHTIFKAPGTIICNAAPKLPHDITSKISFSPIIPRKGNLLFASNERPTKKQRVSNDFNKEDIKNRDNNEVATCDSFKIPAKNAEDLHNNKRGIKHPKLNEL